MISLPQCHLGPLEDTLLQVLQWQKVFVPGLPLKMTMVLRLVG